jgi:nitroreductase
MEESLEFIFRRRSIRKFLERPVEKEKIELLLKAGMAAPSAVNSQPWEFIVIDDPDRLEELRKILPYGKFIAPAAIAVCGNPQIARNLAGQMYWPFDCSLAAENILLAAAGLELGACWVAVHPIPITKDVVARFLGLPRGAHAMCVIYLGYPVEPKPSRTQYDPARIHWQKYGNQPQEADKA